MALVNSNSLNSYTKVTKNKDNFRCGGPRDDFVNHPSGPPLRNDSGSAHKIDLKIPMFAQFYFLHDTCFL